MELNNVTLFGIDTVNFDKLQMAAEISSMNITFADTVLLSDKDLTINNVHEYSKFLLQNTHKFVKTEFVLIIQADGFILNPTAWDNRFLDYDYIGAPWPNGMVGNGGFSLRSRRLMERVSKITYYPRNEDAFICQDYYDLLTSEGYTFAPEELANTFSFEGNYKRGRKWNGEFGFHSFKVTDLSNYFKRK